MTKVELVEMKQRKLKEKMGIKILVEPKFFSFLDYELCVVETDVDNDSHSRSDNIQGS